MSERVVATMAIVGAVGSGVSGGVLFAFSTFIMAALARLPAAQGVAAMQAINVTVINPAFMLVFLGTAAVCLGLILVCVFGRGVHDKGLLILGCLVYVVGCIGVTMVFNVPLNDGLAAFQQPSQDALDFWPRYLREWTMWNHVRAAAAIAAAVMLTLASRST